MSYVEKVKPSLPLMFTITAVGVVSLTALSYLVLLYVDVPVRRLLKQRFEVI